MICNDGSVLLAHLVHVPLLNEIILLGQELVDSLGRATSCDQRITVGQSHGCCIVQELVVWLVDCFDDPVLVVEIQNDDFVRVTEEAKLLVSHLDGAMVHISHVLDRQLQLACVELDLRVGHVDWLQGIGLLCERLLLILEVVDAVRQIGALDLLAAELVNLPASLHYVFLAEADQAEVLVEVLLLAADSRFFYL